MISPFLFNVYVNELAEELGKVSGIQIYLYADDLAVLGDSISTIRKVIRIIE